MKSTFSLYKLFLEKMKERLTGLWYEPSPSLDMKINFSWRITEQVQLGAQAGNKSYYVSYMPLSHLPCAFTAETFYSGVTARVPTQYMLTAPAVFQLRYA